MQLKFKSTLFLIGVHEASHVFASKNRSLRSHGLLGMLPKPLGYGKTKKPIHHLKTKSTFLRLTVDESLIVAERAKREDMKIVEYIRKTSTVRVMVIKAISQARKNLMADLVKSGKRFNALVKNANSGIHLPQELYREMNELRTTLLLLESEIQSIKR